MTNENTKILFLTHVGAPGGAEYKMFTLCKDSKNRAEVLYFQEGPIKEELDKRGIKSTYFPMGDLAANFKRKSNLWEMILAVPAVFGAAFKLIKKTQNFDVIVCMSQKSFILAAITKIFIRKPVIWFMNDLVTPEHFSSYLVYIMTTFARFFADHVVLNSAASFDAWKKAGGISVKSSISYSGIDFDEIKAALGDADGIKDIRQKYSPDQRPLIGMFGRISDWKGQDVFIEAIAKVKDVRAVIVGGAMHEQKKYEEKLQKLSKDLGVSDRLTFVGHSMDAIKIMAACDVIVHASTEPEPFGRVVVEAMAVKKPVIATDAGGVKEIVVDGQTGVLVPRKDSTAIAKAISIYLEKPEWAAKVAAEGRHRAEEKFSADIMREQFSNILKLVQR